MYSRQRFAFPPSATASFYHRRRRCRSSHIHHCNCRCTPITLSVSLASTLCVERGGRGGDGGDGGGSECCRGANRCFRITMVPPPLPPHIYDRDNDTCSDGGGGGDDGDGGDGCSGGGGGGDGIEWCATPFPRTTTRVFYLHTCILHETIPLFPFTTTIILCIVYKYPLGKRLTAIIIKIFLNIRPFLVHGYLVLPAV